MEVPYSIAAGLCAAFGAATSKMAFGGEDEKETIEFAFFLALFLAFNIAMWLFFTKALAVSTSTIKVMALNTGTNFALTGFLGWWLWAEGHSMFWWSGLSLVMAGTAILLTEQQKAEKGGKID